MSGAIVLWAAFPPLDWWLLAWIAPVPWLVLARWRELPGRRPYASLWLAGFVFWLLAVHWLRLPHPATSLGWLALSFYLAFYLPVFVWLVRIAVHRLGISTVIAAPVVWTGLELARGHLLTGFSMALLGHTQFRWLELIQVADLGGAYAVSFLVMFAAACLARMVPLAGSRQVYWPLAAGLALLGAAWAYGAFRLAEPAARPGPKVALIQGSIDTEMKADPGKNEEIHRQYFGLSQRALEEHSDVDLIVWPETMYRGLLITHTDDARPPAEAPWRVEDLRAHAELSRFRLAEMPRHLPAHLLLGIDTVHYTAQGVQRYNSAVFVDRSGKIGDRYDKMHPVMFGEYVPLAERVPWLYGLTPLSGGIQAGRRLPVFEVEGTRLAANICFESAVPHLIRRQVAMLRERGAEPDVLVNLTNDGWFWGSSELDMHLTCGVFRAVELRKPFLVAANTGFSAWIDAEGRIVRQGARRATDVIVAQVEVDGRRSWYSVYGDWPAGLCLAAAVLLGLSGAWPRLRVLLPIGRAES